MSTTSFAFRPPMAPVSRRVRAYFAPVTRASELPSVFDPAQQVSFLVDTPPAPWIDLGWIAGFKRSSATQIVQARGGVKGAAGALARKQLSAQVDFEFREWGKLQLALAGGSQHMNVLATASGATPRASGGVPPVTAVPLLSGSSAAELIMSPANLPAFSPGDTVAVDVDYTGQTGYVGTGVSAAYVKNASDVSSDVNYVRRVTFNVGRISSKTPTSLLLAQPLIGGAPAANASIQKVVALVDREGGSFFQEWSALFIALEESGGRICFHYPRLQPAAAAGENNFMLSDPIEGVALRCSFAALPVTDPTDNEQVLCYRSYFPAASAALY